MRHPYSRIAINRRVLVNLAGGNAVEGVLWDERGELLVLRDAVLLEPGAGAARLDGDVLIERAKVAFVQMPPAAT
jgi:small nuclear ribonucleoprotein (snRNP)-like protein